MNAQESKTFFRLINPIFWPYDIFKLIVIYYDLSEFRENEQAHARFSVFFTYATLILFFPLVVINFGWSAVLYYWFFPWIGFHFWKNSLRLALPSVALSYPQQIDKDLNQFIPVKDEGIKKELLTEMTHFRFPIWFEVLCNDINYQIPHYLSEQIPCYHLKMAHKALLNSQWSNVSRSDRNSIFVSDNFTINQLIRKLITINLDGLYFLRKEKSQVLQNILPHPYKLILV